MQRLYLILCSIFHNFELFSEQIKLLYPQKQGFWGFFSSSTRLLLLLSLYISWVCPAEPALAPLPNLGLIATKPNLDLATYSLRAEAAALVPTSAATPALTCPEPVLLPFTRLKQHENALPSLSTRAQISAHHPRSAATVC
jgi:hypothetical protein